MLTRILLLAAVAVGGGLIWLGFGQMSSETSIRQTAEAFLKAVADGDKETASRLMLNSRGFDPRWPEIKGLAWEMEDIIFEGSQAMVTVQITSEGESVRPVLVLKPGSNGAWKIDRIDGLPGGDPAPATTADTSKPLLQQALKPLPGKAQR